MVAHDYLTIMMIGKGKTISIHDSCESRYVMDIDVSATALLRHIKYLHLNGACHC